MNLTFNLDNVHLVEFGVGRNNGNVTVFEAVPVDDKVQKALLDITQGTWEAMQQNTNEPAKYEPSDKHGGVEYLYIPLADGMSASVRDLHQAMNLPINANAMNAHSEVFCYFARLTDNQQRKLTTLRRATQFKGIIKNKGRLIRLLDDTLQIVEDTIFKLDRDFDLLIDADNVHILHPSGFEFIGKLTQAILNAVPSNLDAIKAELPFVNFESIEQYAANHPRAARYVASIRGENKMNDIDKAALEKLCRNTGVSISESEGKLIILSGHEMAFLEVLDRRRYQLELVPDAPEKFVAASRKLIQ